MFLKKNIYLLFLVLFLFKSTISVSAFSESPTPNPLPTISQINNGDSPDSKKETDLNQNEETMQFIEIQSNVFNATISRIEFYLNILVVFLTILSVVLVIFGFGFSKYYITKRVDEIFNADMIQKIESSIESKLAKKLKEWDEKFSRLYEEVKSIKKEKD